MTPKIKNRPLFAMGIVVLVIWLGLLLLAQDWVSRVHPTLVLLTPILLIAALFMLYKATK